MPYASVRNVVLELESRRRVYEAVARTPGIHLRRVREELGLPFGTVEYHLYQLERFGLLESRKEGKKKAFFLRGKLEERDTLLLYFLRHRSARWILQHLLRDPDVSPSQLSQRLGIGLSTISYHVRRLREAGLIETIWAGRTRRFRLVDRERLERLVQDNDATFRKPCPGLPETPWAAAGPDPVPAEAGPGPL